MNQLIPTSNTVTMSSAELLALVNEAREEFSEPAIRANVFADRIRDELAGDHYKSFVVQNLNNTTSTVFDLTRDQCMLVSMRESKSVRRKVLDRLNKQPELSRIELLQIALDSEQKRIEAEGQRDHAIATKALIGSKREATAMATASKAVREANKLRDELGFTARHATILHVEAATGHSYSFVGLRQWCKSHGVSAEVVPDKRFPKGVKAWPAGAWFEVYGIALADLFGGVMA